MGEMPFSMALPPWFLVMGSQTIAEGIFAIFRVKWAMQPQVYMKIFKSNTKYADFTWGIL